MSDGQAQPSFVEEEPTRFDRFLATFQPYARLIAIAGPYYILGAIFYALAETKPCESLVLLHEPNYDKATCREPWTFIVRDCPTVWTHI